MVSFQITPVFETILKAMRTALVVLHSLGFAVSTTFWSCEYTGSAVCQSKLCSAKILNEPNEKIDVLPNLKSDWKQMIGNGSTRNRNRNIIQILDTANDDHSNILQLQGYNGA